MSIVSGASVIGFTDPHATIHWSKVFSSNTCPSAVLIGFVKILWSIRTAEGHVFEEKTLDQWIVACGSVNPITQAPLTMDMCTVDKDLQKKIVKWFKETNA
jgi:hypothetical protein